MAFQMSDGLIPASGSSEAQAVVASSQSNETYNYPNPTPQISASPSGGAIVWVLDNNANGTDNGSGGLGPAILCQQSRQLVVLKLRAIGLTRPGTLRSTPCP
jgi:hypothetical protein